MVIPKNLQDYMDKILPEARKTYGHKNQIIVTMEELNELTCALAKFCRYEDSEKAVTETREKVIGEVADVTIVLQHVMAIFSIKPEEVHEVMLKKLNRLSNWLVNSNSLEHTTVDRDLSGITLPAINPCEGCDGEHKMVIEEPCAHCKVLPLSRV